MCSKGGGGVNGVRDWWTAKGNHEPPEAYCCNLRFPAFSARISLAGLAVAWFPEVT